MGLTSRLARPASLSAAAFRYIAPSAADLPALAGALSRAIFDDNGGTPYMTAILCQIDPAKGELRYLNAGHPAGRLAGPGRLVRLESTGPLLGGECPLSRAEEELRALRGERVLPVSQIGFIVHHIHRKTGLLLPKGSISRLAYAAAAIAFTWYVVQALR